MYRVFDVARKVLHVKFHNGMRLSMASANDVVISSGDLRGDALVFLQIGRHDCISSLQETACSTSTCMIK